MKSHVLHTVWCNMTGEATGEIWTWSLSGVKGLKFLLVHTLQNWTYERKRKGASAHHKELCLIAKSMRIFREETRSVKLSYQALFLTFSCMSRAFLKSFLTITQFNIKMLILETRIERSLNTFRFSWCSPLGCKACLAACISLSVYNAHDMTIRSDKRSHGRISGKRLRVVGFRNNRVAIK